jgi:glycosyltransferase involved in cell wall biosynthesis
VSEKSKKIHADNEKQQPHPAYGTMSGMISAIILSHNSEYEIERTLLSLSWCDRRIVIDDFSSDNTVTLSKKCKAEVFQRHLEGDFSAQRNFGLEKAKGEWVLFIDSDEVVSRALAREIQKSLTIDAAGFYIRRQDWMYGKKLRYGETGKGKFLRLAKKNAGIWDRPVHEVWKVKGFVGTLIQPLDHFPHPDVAQFISEINMYSTLNARYLHQEHVRIPWWHILAYPAAKFLVDYIWYRGFLDGTPGAIVALMMSMHSFLTRAKLWLLWYKHEIA